MNLPVNLCILLGAHELIHIFQCKGKEVALIMLKILGTTIPNVGIRICAPLYNITGSPPMSSRCFQQRVKQNYSVPWDSVINRCNCISKPTVTQILGGFCEEESLHTSPQD